MISFAKIDIQSDGEYLKLLSAISKLSGLFSDSAIPFINYRVAENIFCKSFNAENLSRSDTAFDANYNKLGVGLKTFICNSNTKIEKIAEFNSLSRKLSTLRGIDLAYQLAVYRNDRIDLASRVYNIENSLYHIIARKNNRLLLFETDYDKIDLKNINSVKQTYTSLQFEDGVNFYSFNFSKSTLFRRFIIPDNAFDVPVEILENPYEILLNLFNDLVHVPSKNKLVKGENFVILPLYGYKEKKKFVFEKSGLNQWNAGGRNRDIGEVYIPIPINIHKFFPDFFPSRDVSFKLKIPTGEVFSAKVCQSNGKALMTDPNKALSDWLLRKVLRLKEGELATIEILDTLGFDSVIIIKKEDQFEIDIMKTGSYESFINNPDQLFIE